MRTSPWRLVLIAVGALQATSPLLASSVLLLSSGDSSNDAAIQSVLQEQGFAVTIGPTYNKFTGVGLTGYNAVFLNPSDSNTAAVNWYPESLVPPDMPQSGQQALINFVTRGGGLVTGATIQEWNSPTFYGEPGVFRTLSTVLPMELTQGVATSNSPIIFSQLTTDREINAGLPSSFSFEATSFNTEVLMVPKAGATGFFATNQWTATFGGAGVGYGSIGWDVGAGRILSLSTYSDNTSLSNADYDRMLGNSFVWAASVPEPASWTLLVVGCCGAGFFYRNRRQLGR